MTVQLSSFDANCLSFDTPIKNVDKYSSKIQYNNGDLIIQTPKVCVNKTPTSILDININSDMYNFFGAFDEKVLEIIEQNSMEWFNQSLDADQSQEIYKRSVHMPFRHIDKTRINVKIIDTTIYNKELEMLEKTQLNKGDEIICLLKCSHLIFYRSYCVPHWEVLQIKVKDKKLVTDKYLIIDLDDDNITHDDHEELSEFTQLNVI